MSVQDFEDCVLPERLARIDKVLSQRTTSPAIVLDNICGEHNISAVIRSADAFGVHGLHLIGPEVALAKGVSKGTERWAKVTLHETPEKALQSLRDEGFLLAVLEPETKKYELSSPVVPIHKLPFEKKLALIFGNEKSGVCEELVRAADYRAFIPMYGFVESFNISVTVALSLFCSTLAPCEVSRKVFPLPAEELERTRAEWIKKSVLG